GRPVLYQVRAGRPAFHVALTAPPGDGTRSRPRPAEAPVAASIEILYLRFPVHPNITVIQIGPGIARIDKEGDSYWVVGTDDGPLAGKKVEIPGDNIAAIQWALEEEAKAAPKSAATSQGVDGPHRGAPRSGR